MMKRKGSSARKRIGPQKAVHQRAVRKGKTTTAKGRKVTANQNGIKQRSVLTLRYVGSAGGRQYYTTTKKRRKS